MILSNATPASSLKSPSWLIDFNWSEGKDIKVAKKDKKKGKHTQLEWVFYNPSHKNKRVEDVY